MKSIRPARGDTIVEVMVALAILGLSFAISYATASHAMLISQNAQEHSQALQYIDSQVELVRANLTNVYTAPGGYVKDVTSATGAPFCLAADGSIKAATDAACNNINDGGGANYSISIVYYPAPGADGVPQDLFKFTVKWPGLSNLGNQQEQIAYKIHND